MRKTWWEKQGPRSSVQLDFPIYNVLTGPHCLWQRYQMKSAKPAQQTCAQAKGSKRDRQWTYNCGLIKQNRQRVRAAVIKDRTVRQNLVSIGTCIAQPWDYCIKHSCKSSTSSCLLLVLVPLVEPFLTMLYKLAQSSTIPVNRAWKEAHAGNVGSESKRQEERQRALPLTCQLLPGEAAMFLCWLQVLSVIYPMPNSLQKPYLACF